MINGNVWVYFDSEHNSFFLSFKEIPEDEIELGKDELLVPVAHFSKVNIYSIFIIILR